MRVVVDANVAFAALLNPDGTTARQVERSDVRLFAPGLLAREIAAKEALLLGKAGCSRAEWRRRVRGFLRHVELVPEARLRRAMNHSRVRRVMALDPMDVAYAAAFVAVKARFLWTRDAALLAEFAEEAVRMLPPPDVFS